MYTIGTHDVHTKYTLLHESCFLITIFLEQYQSYNSTPVLTDVSKLSTAVNSTVKIVPYTFVRRGVPVREDTYPEPSACEVGWPVPFLAAFISPVFPMGTYLLLSEQLAIVQSGH